MRKLLNTVYVTNEMAYLTLDGENLVCKVDGEIKLRIPFENIENIVCFNYLGCSPALMGKCVGKTIPINFISPQGKFLAKFVERQKEMFSFGSLRLINSGNRDWNWLKILWLLNSAMPGS